MAKCIPAVLEWARVDSATIHVSAFPTLSEVLRRSAECPVCGAPVVIRLGGKVRHHVAHRPGFSCPVSAPEGALHLNTKLHLARELALAQSIDIVQRCAHGSRKRSHVTFADLGECERERTRAWGPHWDQVEVEAQVGEFVADILVLRNGKPAAVVEVLSTHEVDSVKAAYFADRGLRWIEILADPDIYSGDSPWKSQDALEPVRIGGDPLWMCEQCAWWVSRTEEVTPVAWEGDLAWQKVHAFTVIDLHFPASAWVRDVILIKGIEIDRRLRSVWAEDHTGRRIGDFDAQGGIEGAIESADELIQAQLEKLSCCNLLVSKRPWVRGANYSGFWAPSLFPASFVWNEEIQAWDPVVSSGLA